jgi:two-component system, NarL family, sensor histidine kinase DesK
MSRAITAMVCDHAPMATSTAAPDTRPLPDADAPGDQGTTAAVSGLESFRRYTYWSMVSATVLLLLLPAIAGPVPYPPDPIGSVSFLAVVVVIATLIPLIGDRITPSGDRQPRSSSWRGWLVTTGAVASVIVAVTWLLAGDDFLWAFAPAMVASVAIAPLARARRRVAAAATILSIVGIGVTVAITGGTDNVGPVASSGTYVTIFALFMTLASRWTWEVVVQLDDARKQAATLAVANERLRFAADLHDIQGHHLQVIALKSELAGRLMHADPETAQREIAEVRRLAADALSDTRAVVQGYRRTSLDAEISNASSVLSSAGIDARLHLDPDIDLDALTEDARHLLGLVVREAVTNVLRHSVATRADITLARDRDIRLCITNDGVQDNPARADGGLHDLADRVRTADGELSWGRDGDHFHVQATLGGDPGRGPASGGAGRQT